MLLAKIVARNQDSKLVPEITFLIKPRRGDASTTSPPRFAGPHRIHIASRRSAALSAILQSTSVDHCYILAAGMRAAALGWDLAGEFAEGLRTLDESPNAFATRRQFGRGIDVRSFGY
jgi:hypothetical protein